MNVQAAWSFSLVGQLEVRRCLTKSVRVEPSRDTVSGRTADGCLDDARHEREL